MGFWDLFDSVREFLFDVDEYSLQVEGWGWGGRWGYRRKVLDLLGDYRDLLEDLVVFLSDVGTCAKVKGDGVCGEKGVDGVRECEIL